MPQATAFRSKRGMAEITLHGTDGLTVDSPGWGRLPLTPRDAADKIAAPTFAEMVHVADHIETRRGHNPWAACFLPEIPAWHADGRIIS